MKPLGFKRLKPEVCSLMRHRVRECVNYLNYKRKWELIRLYLCEYVNCVCVIVWTNETETVWIYELIALWLCKYVN
jgi:hypothetical protein